LRKLPLEVIPHAVDLDTFRPARDRAAVRHRFGLRPDAPTVVMVGNTWRNPLKGGTQAAISLRRSGTVVRDLQVLVVGQHSDKFLASARLPGQALPFVDDRRTLADAYAAADVCLLPSLAENYPLTPLESMAAGTPVCAFAVGGVPEQIVSGQTGLLAAPGDVDALANHLIRILRDPSFATRAGRAARAWVEVNASPSETVARYRFAYHREIDAWRCRRGTYSPRWSRGRFATRIARALGWEPSTTRPQRRARERVPSFAPAAGGAA
jgi:glycosyltransferase involved in cell wall biosynthesis